MSLIIDNPEIERLVAEVAAATGETPEGAILRALRERRVAIEERVRTITERLERDVWSKLPPGVRGTRMTREEEDEILGYGPGGHCV